jgi:serine phosphatase RsbU (regulator of sigma subunit)
MKSSGQPIIRKIVALFGLLILVIIINAVHSMIHESRNLNRQIASNLNNKLEIAASVQRNELDKLRMISISIKEQSGKFADYLDYDDIVPITMILKNIAHLYPEDIDFILLFDEYEELLTSNITGTDIEAPEQYHSLIEDSRERTGIEELSPDIFQEQFAELKPLSDRGQILCFKSLSHILHDTGDIYCYVVVIKLINDNKHLIQKMKETSRSTVTYYDRNRIPVISGFSSLNVPYPEENTLTCQGKSFFTAQKDLLCYTGESLGKLVVAIDKKPFSDSKKNLLLSRFLPFFASTGISILLFLLLKVRVFNKIRQLIQVQRMVAEGRGDLGIRLKLPENRDGHRLDEVEQMGADFNLMMDKLEETHTKVREANQYIMESLDYAKRIQSSMLTNPDEVRRFLPDSFVIWIPRDVVSGDIFLIEPVAGSFLVAVIDCTGHGVPGAFLTMIASSALRRIIREEDCHEPVQILKRLNFIVKTTLRQDTEYGLSDDGMDAAICVINIEERILNFAGAGLSLFYSQDSEIHRIKGDRQSLGYKQSKRSDIHFNFTPHSLSVKQGMGFYMASDGFEDQMGLDEQGKKLKRFGKRRLTELLKEISGLPFEKQRDKIIEVFETHKGDEKSQDDVTVVGFGF